MSLWYVGVGLEMVSTLLGTIGKQLIRMSEMRKATQPRCSRLCLIGGLVINIVVGPLIDMGAYGFAAQSLIAPFGGLDVVWNALLAPWVLQEKMTLGRAAGCCFIVVGTAMAGVFGNHAQDDYTIEYIQETLFNVRVLLYSLGFVAWFLLNRFLFMRYPVGSVIRGLSLGCTAGTIAGNMFCVKAAIELIQRSFHEPTIWLHWLPYVMLIGAGFFALTNVSYMTKGLQEYEALFMVTIYEGSMIVSGCLSGAVVLMDLRHLEAWRISLYSLAVLIIVFGMWVIFTQEAKQRSSMLANKASIEPTQLQKFPAEGRCFHAACVGGSGNLEEFENEGLPRDEPGAGILGKASPSSEAATTCTARGPEGTASVRSDDDEVVDLEQPGVQVRQTSKGPALMKKQEL